jgi:hypothetical protein
MAELVENISEAQPEGKQHRSKCVFLVSRISDLCILFLLCSTVRSFFRLSKDSKNLTHDNLYDHNYFSGEDLRQIASKLPLESAKNARTRKLAKRINNLHFFLRLLVLLSFSVL